MVCTKTKLLFALHFVLSSSVTCTQSLNTLSANQTIKHGETIVSPKETFELGFFSPPNSTSYYIGIWYKKIPNRTIVWVANRNTPLTTDNSSKLTLTVHGVLVLRDAMKHKVWSSANSSTRSVRNPLGQLLDTGNFIISDEADTKQENPIWQSFDYMTDTLLPGMKHGWNFVTRIQTYFTSWKSSDDPAAGEFTSWLDKKGYPQLIVTNRQKITFRQGPWDGLSVAGVPEMRKNPIFSYEFVLNEKEIYFRYNLFNDSVYARVVLQPGGIIVLLLWIDSRQYWAQYWALRKDRCDEYNVCGPFGSCDINNNAVCDCLKGFEPTSPEQWRVADWSQGCRRTTPLNCGPGEGFKKYSNLKLPDTQGSWYDQSMDLKECEKMCKRNCSCTAYTNTNFSGTGSGCLLWFGDLIDIRTFDENGDSIYIRLPPSELDKSSNAGRRVRVIVPIASVVLVLLVSFCLFYRSKRKRQKQEDKTQSKLLDWPARYRIINGIARGLLYLHRDSRLRIIHRDLKLSNILLDSDMNPKISDFGIARSFGGNQMEANTNRIVGTYGYMSPEYAGDGVFSIKSDVYSFGVLMLEIVCGEKNRGFIHKEHSNSLIGHAWELHKKGRSLELVAKCLCESMNASQVLRSIHVGLLCVQCRPEDRPTMTSVILMLASEGPLPSPQKPGFFIRKTTDDTIHSLSSYGKGSNNELSITMLNGR